MKLALTLLATAASLAPVVSGQSQFTNPVLWEDLADNDVLRVNDTYYYSASTMHYSPGAPVLRSYDLVNWEYIGHSVPTLNWGSKYDLANNQRAYIKGIWASTLRYRKSNGLWYWIGCIEFSKTYVYTAPAPEGPWTARATFNTCFYDCGLLIDDDDKMYVAYGNTQISVAQLASDGLSITKQQQVFNTPSTPGTLEGNRMYKVKGKYIIFSTHPASGQWALQSSSPFGPFTLKKVIEGVSPPVSGAGNPHQGSLVDTPNGNWYYMAFIDNYPGGRTPVLAPVTWGSDGFPSVTLVNGKWSTNYPYPATAHPVASTTGTDSFSGSALGPAWEWNHNPDTSKFAVSNGLTLSTATVTSDLYQARNTLTKRIHGPNGVGTAAIDFTNMADGDCVGLSVLRDNSAYVAVVRSGSSYSVVMYNGLTMNSDTWATTSTGSQAASAALSGSARKIWLRLSADIHPGTGKIAQFAYSLDGNSFTNLGPGYVLGNNWPFFMGYRYGIFNFATKALGGSVKVVSFTSA